MAVVLSVLRLCLLLLNLYGTFKAIKPPPIVQRNTRNGQGPSGRAIQLRKREMKSRLAVWVVWAIFSTLERPLDRTIGFLTPFYNEFKCTILLFLIVTRSHGSEAVFLHLIHPMVRPYVPVVDNTLATLQSMFDLVTLILLIPLEYVLHRWDQRSWILFRSSKVDPPSGRCSPDDSDSEDKEDIRRRLRPRNELQQLRMRETDRQTQMILQEIEDAQDRVRMRTRNQLLARNNVRTQPARETRNSDPRAVGLRSRKRVLSQVHGLSEQAKQMPGSRSTGVHHLDPMSITQLARGPQQPSFPEAPTSQPVIFPSPPTRIPTPSSSSQSSHEIWYPPQSAFEAHKNKSPSPDASHRSPSPVYPPLPSAYKFTPRRSDPPPPPPRIMTPPDLVTPTLRRVSTGGMSRGAVDAYEGIDQFPGRTMQPGPSGNARLEHSALHSHSSHEHSRARPEDFFYQALELSIQTMDVDMETLSTRDGSSADESMEGEGGIKPRLLDMADGSAKGTEGTRGIRREPVSGFARSRRKTVAPPIGPVRRSARTRNDRSPSIETDEFGFTIRQDLMALHGSTVDSSSVSSFGSGSLAVGQSKKKPLARSKPALKPTQEEESQSDSSDVENVKKRRKLRPGKEGQPRASARNRRRLEVTTIKAGDARKEVTVQDNMQSNSPEGDLMDRRVVTRATRASTRQPLSAQSCSNVVKKNRGK